MKGYSMLNVKKETIQSLLYKYGYFWKLAGSVSPDGNFAGGTRNKAQAQETVKVWTAPHQFVKTRTGIKRWKAIIVPYIAKATYHWHEKGDKFYIVYIREYMVKK
jgi:hypothetical protein